MINRTKYFIFPIEASAITRLSIRAYGLDMAYVLLLRKLIKTI